MKIAADRNGKETVFGRHGRLHVEGNRLVGEKGEAVRLCGVSTHNMNSYPQYINDDTIEFMADAWGMQLFRLAMYTESADGDFGYADGSDEHRKKLEDMVIRSVEKCAQLGIYVMIDWHILFDYDPRMHMDQALVFFEKMSKRFADYDNVIYEICNEPSMRLVDNLFQTQLPEHLAKWPDEKCSWEMIREYAQQVIPVIRANAPDAVIVCGTPKWSQLVNEAADHPLEYPNIMYALHFYASTHKQELRDTADYALQKGIALYVTEYGICAADGAGAVDYEETGRWNEWMVKNHISCTIWNLSNKDETSAMVRSDCDKLSGWTQEELTESGRYFAALEKE